MASVANGRNYGELIKWERKTEAFGDDPVQVPLCGKSLLGLFFFE
jgi:hypothetical protein